MSTTIADSPTAPHDENAHPHPPGGCFDRRQLLVRSGAAGATLGAVALLAACGSSPAGGDGGGGGGGETTPAANGSLAQVADIPVGGAIAATTTDGTQILLTQPQEGTVVGLSSVCTHQGCTVAPDNAELRCPCHGSVYDLEGKNVSGPAPSPLAPFAVRVENGAVFAEDA